MTEPLLCVRDLKVELPADGRYLAAVAGVDFDLASGETLAIVGESGCGKTMLGRALLQLTPEEARVSGQIRLRGRDLAGSSEREWSGIRGREIALVFQEPAAALDPVRTVGSQIVEAVRRHRGITAREAAAAARKLLAEVSFPDPERGFAEYAHRLSGGLKQRALIAAALAADPAILVADEPTPSLDATVSAEILELFDRLRAGRKLALILITHDLASVARHADRVLVLYAGRVVEEAAAEKLFHDPRHPYTTGLLSCIPRLPEPVRPGRRFPAIAGAVPDLAYRPVGSCAFAPRCTERFARCEASEPPLYETAGVRVRCFLEDPLAPSRPPDSQRPEAGV